MRTDDIRVRLPRPHPEQQQVLDTAARFNVLACGRRWGKSKLGVNLIADVALQGYPCGWFAPTYKLLKEAWRDTVKVLKPATVSANGSDYRLELMTGGVVEFWTLQDKDAGRSRKYKRVVLDEAGLPADLAEVWQAAILPTLADLGGDAWLLGTPKGRNFFWECYERGLDPLHPDWACWQRPTSTNPFIPADAIEMMRAELTERRFQQEVEAAFLDDAGDVFRNVKAISVLKELATTNEVVIGVDWGKSDDYSVFSVWDITERQEVYLDRSNKVDYAVQYDRLQALCSRYRVAAIIAELNSIGVPNVEQLQRRGLPVQGFQTTNATKTNIIDGLAAALEQQSVALQDDPVGIAEMQAYQMERLPSGLWRYSAPAGLHDDIVMARALGYSGIATSGPLLLW